jgi:hypothetical protein
MFLLSGHFLLVELPILVNGDRRTTVDEGLYMRYERFASFCYGNPDIFTSVCTVICVLTSLEHD